MKRVRRSVPTLGMHQYWLVGWAYVMPDFDNKDHSIIEWLGDQIPLEPVTHRVPETEGTREDA